MERIATQPAQMVGKFRAPQCRRSILRGRHLPGFVHRLADRRSPALPGEDRRAVRTASED